MTNIKNQEERYHLELSDLTDTEENIYQLTRDLAGIAKQIKDSSKEDIDPPIPVFEAIHLLSAQKCPR